MQLFASGFSIGFLTVAIAEILIIVYLLSVKNKSDSTKYMILFFAGILMPFINFAIIFSTVNKEVVIIAFWVLHLAIFGIHGLLMFAYHFPKNIFPNEAKLVSKISLSASVLGLLGYIYVSLHIEPIFVFEADVYYYNIPIPGIVIGIQFLFVFITLFRKIFYYSEYRYLYDENTPKGFLKKALLYIKIALKANSKEAKSLKGFVQIFLYAFLVAITILLSYAGLINWVVNSYIIAIGVLILLFFFVIFTVNNMSEPTTFQVKLLGITLMSSLVTLGVIGVISTEDKKEFYSTQKLEQIKHIQTSLEQNNLDAINIPELNYIFEINQDHANIVYIKPNQQAILKPYLGNILEKRKEFHADPQKQYHSMFNMDDYHLFFVNFDKKINGKLYEFGFDYIDYRAYIAQTALKVLAILLVATTLIVIIFPFFFRRNIIQPLNNLLTGVKEVNNGSLNVNISTFSADEIGFLTESFNSMVTSIKNSKEKLENYAVNLESMVETRTTELSDAKQETDRILENVDEGLFLIMQKDESFVIGGQYSKILKSIFMRDDLSTTPFIEILGQFIAQKETHDLEKFLKLMFKMNIDETTLEALNPLNEIEFIFPTTTKYLIFKFRRILKGKKISHLLVTVRDISQQVELEKKLEQTEQNNKSQMEMLFSILNADSMLLNDFIVGAESEIEEIENALIDQNDRLENKIEQIYRSVHTIKGNAALLDLDFLAQSAHVLEEKLQKLRLKENLTGEDFIGISVGFESLQKSILLMHDSVETLLHFKENINHPNTDINGITIKALTQLIEKNTNEELGITLSSNQFDLSALEIQKRVLIKDILIQLVRNSLAHGIESMEERKNIGKSEKGVITLETNSHNGIFTLIYEDDGRGINVDKLKIKAIEQKIISYEKAMDMEHNELAELIFVSGLSSASDTSMLAGRGVGMDLVRDKLSKHEGSIHVLFEKECFTRFIIQFNESL
jgi:HAMP domain-containing protein/HPt (histidine-containing phosphotransfer) domain-containing protein